jgi:hypothetical protein
MREQHPGQLDLVEELSSLTLVVCPDCGATAEVEWQSTLHSSQGPVVLAKIRCLNRHWFLMPRDGLVTASLAASGASTLQNSRRRIRRRGDHGDRSQLEPFSAPRGGHANVVHDAVS